MGIETVRRRLFEWGEPAAEAVGAETPEPAGPLAVIDDALRRIVPRQLVSGTEVVDLLLDLRSAVAVDAAFAILRDDLETR
jgi:hypothetical protein